MKVEQQFSQKPYSQPYSSIGQEWLVNFYLEFSVSPTAKVPYYYVGIPGLHRIIEASGLGAIRGGIYTSNGRCFVVWGSGFYEVTKNNTTGAFSRTLRGKLKTSTGIVRMAENTTHLCLVDGQGEGTQGRGYIFQFDSAADLQQITDQYFPGISDNDLTKGPSFVKAVDTYFIVNSQGTNKYFWSAPGYVPYAFDASNPSSLSLWWGTNYGEKIGDSDNIIAMEAVVQNIFLFGANSMECHRDTGETNGQLFERIDGALINFGCLAKDSVAKYGNDVYWLGRDRQGTIGIFKCGSDFMPQRVSTRGVETRIQGYSAIESAVGFTYFIDGHAYYQIVFPGGTSIDGGEATGASWCFDITTQTWTRRNRWEQSQGVEYRHQMQFTWAAFGLLFCGDYRNDALYYLDSSQFYNDKPTGSVPEYIQGVFTSPSNYYQNKRVVFRKTQLNQQGGFSPMLGQGSDPVVFASWSDDSGVSWSQEEPSSTGATGDYIKRTMWFLHGSSRNRVYRFRMTDPIKRIIIGVTYDLEVLQD